MVVAAVASGQAVAGQGHAVEERVDEGAGESWQSHRFRRRYKPGPSIDELSEEIARVKRQLAMPEAQGVARHKYAPRSRMSRPRIRR